MAKKQKLDNSTFFHFRLITALFLTFMLLTLFMPLISFDKYIEYSYEEDITYTQYQTYSKKYQSSTTPLASKISPLDAIKNIFYDDDDIKEITRAYTKAVNYYERLKMTGEISDSEYKELVASDPDINDYYIATIYAGTEAYARIQTKISLISIILTVLYAVILILWILSIINLLINNRIIYVTISQASWIISAITLFLLIYIFSTSLTNTRQLELVAGTYNVHEMTMFCFAPNLGFILILLLMIAHCIFAIIISNKFTDIVNKLEEVPEFITSQIRREYKHKKMRLPDSYYKNDNYGQKNKNKKKKK